MTTIKGSSNETTIRKKSSVNETGHAKNVANFNALLEFVAGYGATYNPSKVSLTLPELINVKTLAENSLADVITKNTNYNNKINERIVAFSGLKSLATRLINALQTTNATVETINNAKTLNRKMQGKKASSTTTPNTPNTPAPTTISSSQQSYDQLIQHFSGLLAVLQSETSYTPNEVDLQTASIQSKIAELSAKNQAVANAYTSISNARIARNATLYDNDAGLLKRAAEVKKYIKSIFGANSPQFAQVKGIEFKKPKE